ncbi:MAG: hypothetical protein ACRDWS_12795 [Acidimicrobiia bacterium]
MAEQEGNQPDPMGPAILRGIAIGIPVVLVGLTLGIWAITDLDIFESLTTALLPGILLGAFGGGFAGMAMTMRE